MDMSDMSGMAAMGGMDMTNMFTPTNKKVAHLYWYLVAAVVAVLCLRRAVDALRIYLARRDHDRTPARPANALEQGYDTVLAICRELAYPQLWTGTGRFARYWTPPPMGRCLVLLAYWAVILTMLWANTILTPSSPNYAYKWEIVGFRAAWVSVTQLPLIYVLAGKVNLVSLLTGVSYERLNWLHRWVARTLFLTVIVHWAFFITEWDLANFVRFEIAMMPMVKYGFGAWATLGWIVLTGFGAARAWCYELWLLQHLAAAVVLLWLVYVHVPAYARYNVWFAVAVVVFDRLARALAALWVNRPAGAGAATRRRRFGHDAEVTALAPDFLRVRIADVAFSWRPGQHVHLCIPRAGVFETHPFTIATTPAPPASPAGPGANTNTNTIELYLRVHRGFTKRLHRRCDGLDAPRHFLAFLSEPRGQPPTTERFESLVLLATGNGAAFTLPLFEHAVATGRHVAHVSFVWVVRDPAHRAWFADRLVAAAAVARRRRIHVVVRVFVTGATGEKDGHADGDDSSAAPSSSSLFAETKEPGEDVRDRGDRSNSTSDDSADLLTLDTHNTVHIGQGRPDWGALLLPTIEAAGGETGVFACGGAQFTGQIRNHVARLSDDRAVHKGTGAQGLYLFCETYGW